MAAGFPDETTIMIAVRFACVASACIGLLSSNLQGQTPSPVTAAFRDNARDVAERVRLAADAMPADRYGFRPRPNARNFSELLISLSNRTDYLCSRLARTRPPQRSQLSPRAGKDSLRFRVAEAFQYCEQVMASVTDSLLRDSIGISLQDFVMGPAPRVSRALAMIHTSSFWADTYAKLSEYLRLQGRAPPEVCRGSTHVMWNLNQLCDSGHNVCVDSGGGRGGFRLTLADSGYSVTSDGHGPYRAGANVLAVFAARPVGMVLGAPPGDSARAIRVDLNRPVPGDIGKPLGVIQANRDLELSAQWYTEADYTSHTVLEIPVGTTVESKQIEVGFHIDGDYHVLQVGPQGYGHCHADGTAIHGAGTTPGTIRREAGA